MSKMAVAIGAFLFGVCCSTLFPIVQGDKPGSSVPHVNWPNLHGNHFYGGGAGGTGPQSVGIDMAGIGAIPFFNSLDHLPVFEGFTISSAKQPLDGLNCTDCKFVDAVLSYGGGAVNLKGSTFSGTTELQLEGAAANTVALLEFLKALPSGRLKYKLPIPDKPITKRFANTTITAKPPAPQPPPPAQKMDFTAPYIGPR